jgi:hypothetical protein
VGKVVGAGAEISVPQPHMEIAKNAIKGLEIRYI